MCQRLFLLLYQSRWDLPNRLFLSAWLSVVCWAFVPIGMVPFKCPSVRVFLSVVFVQLWVVGRNPSSFSYEGRHPSLRRWISLATDLRALRRASVRLEHAMHNRSSPPFCRFIHDRRQPRACDLAEISSTWAPPAWPRSVRRERLQRARKSCRQQAPTRASRAMNGDDL